MTEAATASDVYRAFTEFDDMRSTTARYGVPLDSIIYKGRSYSFGAASLYERRVLDVVDARYFRDSPAMFLSGLKDGERVLIRRRAQERRGSKWTTPLGQRSGVAVCWVQAGEQPTEDDTL